MRTRIAGLGEVGLVLDIPAHDLPPSAVTEAVNVAFRDGAITRSAGLTRAHTITGDAVWIESWFSTGNGRSLVVSEVAGSPDASIIYEIVGGVVSDISPATPIATGYVWDSCVFGNTALLNNGASAPLARTITSAGAIAALPNWPAGWTADIIRPYRNFLVAMRVTEGANFDDTRVAWSNASGNNDVPPDWDGLDPASLAGGISLAGDGGPIQDAAQLGTSLVIYTQRAAHAMTLTGGQFVMSFRPMFNRGLLGRRCVIPFDSFHFCIGNGVVYTHDGSSLQYPASKRVQSRFFRELGNKESIRLSHDASRRIIEIAYSVDPDSTIPTRSLTWNYENGSWRFEDYEVLGVVRGLFVPDSVRLLTWDTVEAELGAGTSWNDIDVSWRGLDLAAGDLSYQLLAQAGSDSAVLRREDVQLRDGAPFLSQVGREKISFDGIIPPELKPLLNENLVHVKRIVPHITGAGTVYFQFGVSQNSAEGTIWGAPVPFAVGTDWKVDFRASGRFFAWRLLTNPAESATFRLSGFDVEVDQAGSR